MSLSGLAVIITRPVEQGKALSAKISAIGGRPFLFPTLEIIPLEIGPEDRKVLTDINHYDMCIFTSQNAVNAISAYLPPIIKPPIAAMGPATAKALGKFNLFADIQPTKDISSEDLLTHHAFHNVSHKKILIITGEGGRDFLQQQLIRKQVQVRQIAVYRRRAPIINEQYLQEMVRLQHALVITTSGEALINLKNILNAADAINWLLETPIVIISQRMKDVALQQGFDETKLILADNASDEAILESIIKWYASR